jgi:Mg2+-importing ATPase
MFSFKGGTVFLPFEPMSSPQILVNNLLYDFSQLAIPTDKVDEEYLLKPRKWNIDNVKKFMIYIGPISSIFDYATFGLMWFVYHCSTHVAGQHDHPEKLFQTAWFVESLLTQTLIVHIIRTNKIPFIQSTASWPLLMSTLFIMAVGSWLPYSPPALANFLGFVPLPASLWFWMGLFLLSYAVLCHHVKVWFLGKFGTD